MPRSIDREARRAELVDAAAATFATKGVTDAAVSDIVAAAGVAQGTFYLYFASKDDVVLAVAERFGDRLVERIELAVAATQGPAVEKLMALRDVLADSAALAEAGELVDVLHHPGNRAIHDRLTDHLTPRLVAVVEQVVEQGVAEGTFAVADVRTAAWFVLGGLRSAELSGVPSERLPAVLDAVMALALRALGCPTSTDAGSTA